MPSFSTLTLPDHFLARFWQQKPCLIRQASRIRTNPISAEELAGLACEEEIESRLVIENTNNETGLAHWSLRNGPFEFDDFSRLPEHRWTLLVQDIDKIDAPFRETVQSLLAQFRFIPDWRFDDLMISYAADGGSVGPHWDEYDVFLLQVEGRRHWSIGEVIDSDIPVQLLDNSELRILADFKGTQSWLLEPGDMLYLPPGVPHFGVADGPCMTWSIGYRAPAGDELLDYAVQQCLDGHKTRFRDPARTTSEFRFELQDHDLQTLRASVQQELDHLNQRLDTHIAGWLSLGKEHLDLRANAPSIDAASDEERKQALQAHDLWSWAPELRRLFTRVNPGLCQVFIAGQHVFVPGSPRQIDHWLSADLFPLIPAWLNPSDQNAPEALAFIRELARQGLLRKRVSIAVVDWSDYETELSALRREVFIEEQGVAEALEWDGADVDSLHVIALSTDDVDGDGDGDDRETAIACGRLKADGQAGRMAVRAQWRRRGIGDAVLAALLDGAREQGMKKVWLNAQTRAIGFYAARGFEQTGNEFPDAGIPHVRMEMKTNGARGRN